MQTYSKWEWQKGEDGVNRRVATCTICGKPYSNGHVAASKYCPECGLEVRREKTRERVRRYREKDGGDRDAEGEAENSSY